MPTLTPAAAGALMRRARDLVAARTFRAHHIAVLDYLLWRARPHGADRCQVSYRAMADNLHLRRATLVEAVRDLAAAGLLTKLRTWVWVMWEGFRVKRQATNAYVFADNVPPRAVRPAVQRAPGAEFRGETTVGVVVRKKEAREEACTVGSELEVALARLGALIGCSAAG